jgi:hypothetical protein
VRAVIITALIIIALIDSISVLKEAFYSAYIPLPNPINHSYFGLSSTLVPLTKVMATGII